MASRVRYLRSLLTHHADIYEYIIMSPHRRGPWSQGEDAYLLQLVQTQGAHNWVRIAHIIGSRSPKQCRERFHQNLKPTLNHEPISPEEGILIERYVGEMGKRWAEIARRLHGRSDNAVKNWWNGSMNRRRRLVIRKGHHGRPGEFDETKEQLSFARPVGFENTTMVGTMVNTTMVEPKHYSHTPLQSPSTASDMSADAVPSLVSDNASTYTTSPRPPPSPAVELPPLIGTRLETRRPSLPILHLGTNNWVSEQTMHQSAFHERLEREQKLREQEHTVFRRPADVSPRSATEDYHYMRHHNPSENQLPLIRPLTPAADNSAKDQRMTLSSILG
jgi:Myb-like DNA-binding protein FlbD